MGSSDSDSDSDSNASTNEKSCQLLAAMEESPAPAASNPGPLSMPGDFNDLFLPGGGGGGQLPTARPQKHKKTEKMKQKVLWVVHPCQTYLLTLVMTFS